MECNLDELQDYGIGMMEYYLANEHTN